jgi:hypothetical protein
VLWPLPPAVSVAQEARSTVPPEPASEATVSLPPTESPPLLTVSEAESAGVLAEVVATVTPLAVVKEPDCTSVVPAHTWLAFTGTAVFRPGATVKSTLACVALGPRAVFSVRFVVVPVSLP